MKLPLLKIGHPRRAYRWVLNWGHVDWSDDGGMTYPYRRFSIWIGRAYGRTITVYSGPRRVIEEDDE